MSGIPQGGITNLSYWKLMYGSCSFINLRMNLLQNGSKNRCGKCRFCVTIFALVAPLFLCVLFSFSMSEPLDQRLFFPPCSVTPTSLSSMAPRQNLPPVPHLPPPAAPMGHRPTAPPPAGRGQILDATWGAPQQRPATPAPLWAPCRVHRGRAARRWRQQRLGGGLLVDAAGFRR